VLKARKRGDRLTVDVQLASTAWSAGQLDLTEAKARCRPT
jgi:hypothetical protein